MVAADDELNLGSEEDANLINRLRVEFLDVFASHPEHRNQAKSHDLHGIARRLALLVPELSTDFDVRKLAESLADRFSAWPTIAAFEKALKRDGPPRPRPAPLAPVGWRWKRGQARPTGVDASAWYAAGLAQEAAAKHYLTADLDAQALVQFALDHGWLTGLFWHVVEHGRLPSLQEQQALIAQQARADRIAVEAATDMGGQYLTLRQAMHDYAARQLGLEAKKVQ